MDLSLHNAVVYSSNSLSTFLLKTMCHTAVLNNKLVLMQYYMSYILLRQNLTYPKISLNFNLSNINVLFQIFPLPYIGGNDSIVKKRGKNDRLSKSLIDQILSNIGSLNVLNKFRIISQKSYDYIKSLVNDSSRSKKPVIPDFSENPDNVNKNMEISSLNNEQTSNLTYKKRRVPDFDDTYYVVPPKRIKSNVIHKETGNNLDASPEECISQSFASSSNRETNESFQTVIRQWEVNCLANPHRNYTHCACITGAEYEQQYEYNKHNFSCLKYFDDEIAVIDQNICITSQRIEDLHKEYRAVNNFSISNIINKEKRNETDLKNRYASLCDARNEIFNLYVNQKNSTKLNFDAELMPQSEINMIKINREMLNSFQNHYGM